MRTTLVRGLCLALLLVAGACASTPREPDPSWREAEVVAPSDRVLWKIALLAAERMRFPRGGSLDPGEGRFQTGWRTNLQPFSGKGDRTRAVVELEPVERGRWRVRVRVQRQANKAIADPLNPARAEWEWTGDDVVQAEILLRHVVSALDPELELEEAPADPFEERLRR